MYYLFVYNLTPDAPMDADEEAINEREIKPADESWKIKTKRLKSRQGKE